MFSKNVWANGNIRRKHFLTSSIHMILQSEKEKFARGKLSPKTSGDKMVTSCKREEWAAGAGVRGGGSPGSPRWGDGRGWQVGGWRRPSGSRGGAGNAARPGAEPRGAPWGARCPEVPAGGPRPAPQPLCGEWRESGGIPGQVARPGAAAAEERPSAPESLSWKGPERGRHGRRAACILAAALHLAPGRWAVGKRGPPWPQGDRKPLLPGLAELAPGRAAEAGGAGTGSSFCLWEPVVFLFY